ncbi:MAG: ATP-binding cassette domain-containing protein [candidate division WOR-3 bacterium]
MIEIRNLYKSFNRLLVLADLNLQVGDGETVIVTGESGCGKTVLLKMINGLLLPDRGQVIVDGIEINKLPERELLKIRRRIGFVFQSDALFDSWNVYENLALFLRMERRANSREKIERALAFVGLLGKERLFPSELSGGMKKRVAIAREIVRDPKYLLLDEPTANLDGDNTKIIIHLIGEMQNMGITMVVVTHDPRMVGELKGRYLLLKEGKLWEMRG